jgi:hypothetical protein
MATSLVARDRRQPQFPFTTNHSNVSAVLWMIPSGKTLAGYRIMSKRFVYVLRNHDSPPKYYTGLGV